MNKKLLLIFGIIFIIATIAIGFLLTQQQTPIIKTAEVTLTIHPSPDFTLVVTPEHIDSFPDRVVPYNASVTSVNNFAGEVIFSVSGLPPEIIVTYFPSIYSHFPFLGCCNKGIYVIDDPEDAGKKIRMEESRRDSVDEKIEMLKQYKAYLIRRQRERGESQMNLFEGEVR